MNQVRWLMLALILVVVVCAAILLIRQIPPSAVPPSPSGPAPAVPDAAPAEPGAPARPGEPAAAAPEAGPVPALEAVAAVQEPLDYTPPIRETVVLQEGAEPREIVRVRPEQVLATVNGTPVTLRDLAATPGATRGTEQTISASLYEALLERAVVREVAVQAAQAQGIILSPEQQAQLEKMKAEMTAESDEVKDLTMSPERLEFDLRDTQGRMLMVNLVAAAGAPSPFVTEELVKAYYESHKADFEALPEDPEEAKWAWRRIDREIRNLLAGDTTATYQQAYDQVVADLKSQASIEVTEPVAP